MFYLDFPFSILKMIIQLVANPKKQEYDIYFITE